MQLRDNNLRLLQQQNFDVLIIGGGINGAVAAAALSAKGVKTALVEKKDFASSTSQESSNLIWGGIKYLESFDFRLVYDLCGSRNRLIREYPSTVQEIRFLTVHEKNFRRSRFILYAGALLYWIFGRFFTAFPHLLTRKGLIKREKSLNVDNSDGGMEYSDAYLHDNDARFVFGFIRRALNHGAIVTNYTEVNRISHDPAGKMHEVRITDRITGKSFSVRSHVIINACGPEADLLNLKAGIKTRHRHVLSKGIHLIVDRITDVHKVLAFFADDGRLFFAIPMGPKTCIGTTDTRVDKLPARVTPDDRQFVLDNINKRLKLTKPLTTADIIAERCGVRPLVVETSGTADADWMQMSRKHAIDADLEKRYISVFGGKLTDCLNIGEEICRLVRYFGIEMPFPKNKWYGEPSAQLHREFLHQADLMNLDAYTSAKSSEPLSARLWRRYGGEAFGLLDDIRQDPAMAELLIDGAEYLRCEIHLAARREMVTKLDDFLRRRSKIALIARKKDLEKARGLKEAARIFFGGRADFEIKEYFRK